MLKIFRLKNLILAGIMGSFIGITSGPASAATAPPPVTEAQATMINNRINMAYQMQTARAGGTWYSQVQVADQAGTLKPAVEERVDTPVWAYSVNKLAVALAVMEKVDRGQLSLGQKLELTPDIIAGGSGIYHLQTVYGDNLTIANLMTAMLMTSDNTAVRMLSQVAPGTEINEILAAKGFVATHVDPVPGSTRFFLGQTTPREMSRLLEGLAKHTLVSEQSSTFILNILRWVNGYNDGIRHHMSSLERAQVATKYGAFEDSRHEVGIMFDTAGAPAVIYAFFNDGVGDTGNYGATNPAVMAEAALGRKIFDLVNNKRGSQTGRLVP